MPTTISDLDVFLLQGPEEDRPHWVSNFTVPTANEILIRLRTDDRNEDVGLATSYTNAEAILHVLRSGNHGASDWRQHSGTGAILRRPFSL